MAPFDARFLAAFAKIFASADLVGLPSVDVEIVSPIHEPRAHVESLPRVTVSRPSDLARVEFRFVNLDVADADSGRTLVRGVASRPAYLVAAFGPQHLLEQAFFDPSGDTSRFVEKDATTPDPPGGAESPAYPIAARLSGSSRLAFIVTTERIPYSQAGLLHAMRVLPLSVAPHAEGHSPFLDWHVLADDLGALSRAEATLADVARIARLERTASELELRFGAHSAVAAVADSIRAGVEIGARARRDRRPPVPREPTAVETAIELPWRLQLSPHSRGAFMHAVDEVEHSGRVELWHTRLGWRTDAPAVMDAGSPPPVDESASPSRTVRAVWTRDFTEGNGPAQGSAAFPIENLGDPTTLPPFRATLSARDRMQLVHLTSNHRYPGASRRWSPSAVPVENLMLTTLGGWLASEVHFPDPIPPGLSVEEWQHRATMGRDHFVKVVYQGILLPFGHRASLIKVTERRVKGDNHATLYQRLFVVLRQPERRYLASGDKRYDNVMPFRWVRILTAATPPLALPVKLHPEAEGQIFIPSIATSDTPDGALPPAGVEPFRFRMIANDIDNRLVEFEGPLIFVEKTVFETARSTKHLILFAANEASPAYQLRGQRIAYAPPADPDDTTLATTSVTFDALFDTKTADRSRNFVLPVLRVASAVVPAMSAFTGQTEPKHLTYAKAYREHAFSETGTTNNKGGVFLELADGKGIPLTTPAAMNFSSQADKSGAFLSPNVDIKALARKVGPVGGDLAALASTPDSFDVGAMFGALGGAKLFGILPLSDLLPASGSPLPKFVTQAVNTVVALQQGITQARAFALEFGALLDNQTAAVQQAAVDLATAADQLANAIVVFSQPPHPPQDFEDLLGTVVQHASTLHTAFGTPDAATPLKLPRPVIERTDALLQRITGVAGDIGAVAGLIEQFYTGSLLPEQVSARLEWQTELVPWAPAGVSPPVFEPQGDKLLRLTSEIQAPLGSGRGGAVGVPTQLVSCSLPPFRLLLLGSTEFIAITVAVMEFSVRPGRKPDVNVQLDEDKGIEFLGPLAFVETLKEIIPFDGFSDPPYLDVQTSGLKAGFDLAIPDLAVGVFALTNIHLGAELSVPFIGESLEFRFFFASREDPFRLSVAFFAGGGFFAITISPKGVRMIEASFEFGAAVEMSFVVASGSLSVMAGIYFRLEIEGESQSVQLTGFFRARGEVDVLGLIQACIELYLELSYRSISGPGGDSAKAVGKASISVEVSVCFLSFSVSVSCEKQFAGSSGDPTFEDAMGPYTDAFGAARDPWAEYCAAFAPEPV